VKPMVKQLTTLFIILFTINLAACTPPPPPQNPSNICCVFQQYPKWYWAAQKAEKRYGIPVPVQMAIIRQESSFKAKAKPPRKKILWVIPWFRPSSAYGYAQILNPTWKYYKKAAGKHWVSRSDMTDAINFVAWYTHRAVEKCGISPNNAYALYLAYHEGTGGYNKKTFNKKPTLIHIARGVQWRAKQYELQIRAGKKSLPKKPWWHIF